jgi:glycosyltransferase involved in cell wall biosynthesis
VKNGNGSALRIAFVADTMTSAASGGVGAGRRFVDLLRERHRVTVIGAQPYGPDSVELPGFVLPLRAMRAMDFVMAYPVRSVLAEAIADADVVHLQFPFWLSFAALDVARRVGRPVVAAFHVQPENALANVGLRAPWLSAAIYREWVRRYFDLASAVVCPSAFAARKLRSHGLSAPTFVVSNGVPPDMELPTDAAREPAHRGYFVVMMVGRLAAEKRQDVLIDAVRASRHAARIKLVIAGAGPCEAALRRRAQSLPNGAEIGFVPRPRLRALLASADLFVHCSEVELEGIAVLEAMSMGLPALVAEGPESAASELALEPRFRFPAGDARALARRLDELIEHPARLARARPQCRDLATRFRIEASAAQLEQVYRFAIEHGAPTVARFARATSAAPIARW